MKTFRCNQCGHQLQRPTQPYKCPGCGRQAVGLFRLVADGRSAPRPGVPPPPPGVSTTRTAMPPTGPAPPAGAAGPPPPPPARPDLPPPPPPPTQQAVQQPPAKPAAPQQPAAVTPPRAQQAAAEEATEAAQVEKAAVEPPQREKAERARQMKRQATPAEAQPPAAAVEERAPAKPKPQPTRPEQFAWAFPEEVPEQLLGKPMHHAPAVDSSGRIYLHTGGRLAALEESQGLPKICWEYSTGSHAPGPVTVAPDGNIRVHCSDGLLHCVSPEGKQIHMPARVGEPLGYAVPATDQAGNTWISAYDGGLIKIDADGRVQTSPRYFRSRRRFDAPGVIHQGVLYIGSEEGYTFAIRLDDRRGTNLWNHAAEQGHTGWYVHSWPAITEDGVLVMAGREEHLYGFAPDGRTLWKTDVSGQMLGSPVIDRHGQIYVGVSHWQRGRQPQGRLVCVDGNSHKIRWHYQADGPVESTPVIGDDDLLYFGDNSGVIHAIDLRGDPHWKAHVGAAVRSAGTILAARRLAFGLDDETLIVLTCSSQRLAQTAWPRIGCTLGQCGLSC